MTIYLDVSAAVHRRAGLGRYAESLTRALVAAEPHRYALFYNRERSVEPLSGLEHLPARTVALGYKPWRMLVWLAQLARLGFDRLLPDAELFHATEHLLLPLRSVPAVLTVHDLIFRHLPQHHKPLNRWYLNLALPLYCRRAAQIIAVSEHTRRDLLAAYGLPPEKVTVVYEAADPRFVPQPPGAVAAVRAHYGLPERYLLAVGTIEPRKNLTRLLAAFEVLHDEGLSDALVVVGRRGWLTGDFFAALERSPARAAVLLPGYLADDDLPAVYAGAQLLAFPSLCEGFGLPLLEAMACGTPAVAARAAALPEIGGDAARYFDPISVEEMVAALRDVLRDALLREEMARRGLAQAARFSWPRAAQETRAVYQRVLARAHNGEGGNSSAIH
jgi:glycosyltransferase involved in cell wall biosynthesis